MQKTVGTRRELIKIISSLLLICLLVTPIPSNCYFFEKKNTLDAFCRVTKSNSRVRKGGKFRDLYVEAITRGKRIYCFSYIMYPIK